MNKIDKIGYFVKETGEEISKEIYDFIVKEEKQKRFMYLSQKFKENKINKEELLELMRYRRINTNCELYYDVFYKVNMNKSKPKLLSKAAYGDFFQLLNFLSYSNTLTHKNGKIIKMADIATYLEYENKRTLKRFFDKLQENKMIAFFKMGGIEYLIINPAYAQRKIKLNYTVFKLFEEDLKEYLDEFQIKLLELEEEDFEINSINPIET